MVFSVQCVHGLGSCFGLWVYLVEQSHSLYIALLWEMLGILGWEASCICRGTDYDIKTSD